MSEDPADFSEATFELSPAANGEVQLILTHRRLAKRDQAASVGAGWHTHIATLAALLAGDTPTPFWATYNWRLTEYEKRVP
jgi:hypothetical protein